MGATGYVVGFDGSDGAAAALRWALAVAAPDDSPVAAVAVWPTPAMVLNPWMPAPVLGSGDLDSSFSDEVERRLALVDQGHRSTLEVIDGSPGPAIVAAGRDARCLVVGRRGHGGFAGLLLGSVADYCLRHASGAVALVPIADTGTTDGAIVVGVDGSKEADAAVRFAASEADRLDRRLVALHAWDWLGQPGEFSAGFDDEAARRYAAGALARALGDRPVAIEAVNDQPARALMARSAAGDLVVVGSRGLGAVRGALLGSVSRQLAHHAPSTVIIVHTKT